MVRIHLTLKLRKDIYFVGNYMKWSDEDEWGRWWVVVRDIISNDIKVNNMGMGSHIGPCLIITLLGPTNKGVVEVREIILHQVLGCLFLSFFVLFPTIFLFWKFPLLLLSLHEESAEISQAKKHLILFRWWWSAVH